MVETLRRTVRLVEVGEAKAIRIFSDDGTHRDLVFGGTEADQAAALADLCRVNLQ